MRPAALRRFLQRVEKLREGFYFCGCLGCVFCQLKNLVGLFCRVALRQQLAPFQLHGLEHALFHVGGRIAHVFGDLLKVPGKLIQSRGQNIRSQPSFGEAFAKRSLRSDYLIHGALHRLFHLFAGFVGFRHGVFHRFPHRLRRPHQRLLKKLAAHSRINHRIPVLKPHCTGRNRLRKLIHGAAGLLAGRAGYGG